jgi:CRP-like cAMP-binding protein
LIVHDTRGALETVFLSMLGDAPTNEIEAAGNVLRACSSVAIAAGDMLNGWRADAPLVVVEAGLIVVRTDTPGRRDVVVADAGPGTLVFLTPGAGAVQALSETQLLLIGVAERDELLGIPAAAALIAEGLSAALAQSHDVSGIMAASPSRARIERKLMMLARTYGRVARDGVRVDVPLTHELLADMTGTARETVTRVLDVLEREGFLTREGRTYRLLVAPDELG